MENGLFIIPFHANNNKINHLVSDPHGVPQAVLIRLEAVAMGSVTQKADACIDRALFINKLYSIGASSFFSRLPTFVTVHLVSKQINSIQGVSLFVS